MGYEYASDDSELMDEIIATMKEENIPINIENIKKILLSDEAMKLANALHDSVERMRIRGLSGIV